MAESTVAANSTRDVKSEDSNLTVAMRIRPMMEDEILQGARPIAHCVDDNLVILMDPLDDADDVLRQNRSREKQFMFDVVFDAKATQEQVYRRTCSLLIPSVINGYNATVFAYGATGAGKTFTMLGRDEKPGIMAQALTELFLEMEKNGEELSYRVTMSYLEIYNEMIRDLLNPGVDYLDLREDANGIQVAGLSEHSAKNTAEVMAILKEGNKQRTQEPTAANKTSSRSHAVLIISVRQRNRVDGIHQQLRVGKLFLIDLAGSERAANTQNRGKRMVEGAHINRSLLALGNCINALSDKHGTKYINYRDSKLTRLLKDALGGNCQTVMIAHVSPASFFFEESRNTLTYADRAKSIRTKVRQNVLDMTLHISQYSNIIADLREEIRRLKQKLDQQGQAQRHPTSLHGPSRARDDDDIEFSRLINELQNVLKNQNEQRKRLVELNKSEAELNVESTRLRLELSRFENDQRLKSNQRNARENLSFDAKKAKKKIETLTKEMKVSERQKKDIERKLADLGNKTLKLHEDLRGLSNSSDRRDILSLLSHVEALELQNSQLQSDLLARTLDLRRRDLVLSIQDHQRQIESEVVQQQRALIGENGIAVPSRVVDLQNVYRKEAEDLDVRRNSLLLPSLTSKDSSVVPNANADRSGVDGERLPRLFEPVQHDKRLKTLINSTKVDSNYDSTSSSPLTLKENAGTVEDLIIDNEERLANNHAALLAAKRRGPRKIHATNSEPDRHPYKNYQYREAHLTESRLAQHNRRYDIGSRSNPTTSDKQSLTTADTAQHHRYAPNARTPRLAKNRTPLPTTVGYNNRRRDGIYRSTNQKTAWSKDGFPKLAATNRMDAKLNGHKHIDPYASARVPPTIPATYRKGDISVTGQSYIAQ